MTANPTPPTLGRPLTETERTMLRYALDQAQEQMLCVGDEFSEDDHDAIDSLRRLAGEAPQQEPTDRDVVEAHDAALSFTRKADHAQLQPEPSVHGESVAHLAGIHGRRDQWAGDEQPVGPVHAVPLPGSNGISACCGRPPCEFVGERVTRDPEEVTCTGPAVDARQDGEA